MLNKKHYLMFIIISSVVLMNEALTERSLSIHLKQNQILVRKYNDHWSVTFVCQSYSRLCMIEYIYLPEGWKNEGKSLLIPIKDINRVKQYIFEVKISGSVNNYAFLIIILGINNGIIESFKTQTLYSSDSESSSYTQQSNSLKQNKRGTDKQISATKNIHEAQNLLKQQQKNKNYITSALISSNKIGDQLSLRIIDEVLASENTKQLSSVINNIIQKSDCSRQYSRYIFQIGNQIGNSIEKNQLRRLKENNRPKTQESGKNNKITVISISSSQNQNQERLNLQNSIEDLRKLKISTYSEFYSYQTVAKKYEDKLIQLNKDNSITENIEDLSKIKNYLEEDKQRLSEIDGIILKLTQQKNNLKQKISINQQKITNKQSGNKKATDSSRIKSIEEGRDKYYRKAVDAKARHDDATQNLENYLGKMAKLELKIKSRQKGQQVNNVTQNEQSKQLARIQSSINDLKKDLDVINKEFIRCESISSMRQNIIKKTEKIPINIFASQWRYKYGFPHPFTFSCSANELTVSGFGIIVAIDGGQITLGDSKVLRLGSCSKFSVDRSSWTSLIGNQITWIGREVNSSTFNVYEGHIVKN